MADKNLKARWDSFVNAFTGLGGTRDKRTGAQFVRDAALDEETLDSLYHNNDLAAKLCDTYPEEALRQRFTIKVEDDGADTPAPTDPGADAPRTDALDPQELSKAVKAKMEDLGLVSKVQDAAIWGNVFGAACVFMGADDGRSPELPLVPERVRAVRFLSVYDRRDLQVAKRYSDPLAPKYDEPELYRFTNRLAGTNGDATKPVQDIHESRLVFFYGSRTAKRRRAENNGWPHSKLQKAYEVIRDFETGWSSASYLLQEASQAVYGVHGLLDIIASADGRAKLETRMQVIDMGRSVARALVIDAEGESFERKATTFSGVPELLDRLCARLASAFGIPVTLLMGQAPAGLNATGASDVRAFYDHVQSYRTDVLGPAIEKIARLLILEANAGKEPDSWCIEWPSLYQPTDKEQAETRQIIASTDKTYVDMGVVSAEEIALSRFGAGGYSAETTIDLQLRQQLADIEATQALDRKLNPPAPPPADPNTQGTDPNGATGNSGADNQAGESPS